MKTITSSAGTVGIYENTETVARVYRDRTVVTVPYIHWAGNSGRLATRRVRLAPEVHAAVWIALLAGDEAAAWREIDYAVEAGWCTAAGTRQAGKRRPRTHHRPGDPKGRRTPPVPPRTRHP
jgi:hypothetical protein